MELKEHNQACLFSRDAGTGFAGPIYRFNRAAVLTPAALMAKLSAFPRLTEFLRALSGFDAVRDFRTDRVPPHLWELIDPFSTQSSTCPVLPRLQLSLPIAVAG